MSDLKYRLAAHIENLITVDLDDHDEPTTEDLGIESIEVKQISALTLQFRIKEPNGAPRYFNLKLSEML